MHHAVADELRILERRDHGKHAALLPPRQVRLEADHIVYGALGVVTPELHNGIVLPACARVSQPHGLERPVAQRIHAAARHHLNRHTALENAAVVKAVHLRLLRFHKLGDEGEIFILIHRAVDVVRRALIIARGEEGAGHVHAFQRDYGGDGVIKVQVAFGAERGYLFGDGVA